MDDPTAEDCGGAALPELPGPDYAALDDEALRERLAGLAANLNVAHYHLLRLIGELQRRGAWFEPGILSCAHWLSWRCGIALNAAREKVRVAEALAYLPLVAERFAAGEFSYSKVRAITRVATPENEATLVNIARYATAAQLEVAVRAYRRVRRQEENALAMQGFAQRYLQWQWDEDGMLSLRARLPAEDGAVFLQALHAAAEAVPLEAIQAEQQELQAAAPLAAPAAPGALRDAEALVRMAESSLAQGVQPGTQAERFQVMVHVDAEALARQGEGERCGLEPGPAIAAENARRIACDASRVDVLEVDGQPLAIGRRARTIPAAIRRALKARDGGCRFPGCTNDRRVDAHHIEHWADGGETRLDNLVLLCRRHHRLLHEGGFNVELRDDGRPLFFDSQGRLIPAVPQAEPTTAPEALAAQLGAGDVSAETMRQVAVGERMHLPSVIDVLVQADYGLGSGSERGPPG